MEREMILAVDIGGSKYVAGLVAADGTVICKEKYRWSRMSVEQVTADQVTAQAGRTELDAIYEMKGRA